MIKHWFYAKGADVFGPLESAQLRAMVDSGQVQASDMVTPAGETHWVPAASVAELFAGAPANLPAANMKTASPSVAPGKSHFLAVVGCILTLLSIAALALTAALFYRENIRLRSRVDELQSTLDGGSQTKHSAPDQEIARLESLRAEDARIIQDLKRLLPKDALKEEPKNLGLPRPNEKKSVSYEAIDRHALQTPKEAEQSLDSLAEYLTAPAANDEEKTRAIFRWIADRVEYDGAMLFSGKIVNQKADQVLRSRKCVCAGYAKLFEALCRRAGVEVAIVTGYAKGASGNLGETIKANHDWNAVKIKGSWRLLDVTWASGGLRERTFVKKFDDFFFFAEPDWLILTHYPNDPKWQLLNPPIGATEFGILMRGDRNQLRRLISLGLAKKEVLFEGLKNNQSASWVKTWIGSEYRISFLEAPLNRQLDAGTQLHVKVAAPDSGKAGFIMNGKFIPLKHQGDYFEGTSLVVPGTVAVSLQLPGKGEKYWHVLEYVVK